MNVTFTGQQIKLVNRFECYLYRTANIRTTKSDKYKSQLLLNNKINFKKTPTQNVSDVSSLQITCTRTITDTLTSCILHFSVYNMLIICTLL